MAQVRAYRVGYIDNDGKKRAFTFMTDKSFRQHGTAQSAGVLGFGYPFTVDMCNAGSEHTGFQWDNIKMVHCLDTGEHRWF